MRRLMAVIAAFGLLACSGSDGSGDERRQEAECAAQSECDGHCVRNAKMKCEGDSTTYISYRCLPTDDPGADPGAICDTGERCYPLDKCDQSYIDSRSGSCQMVQPDNLQVARCVGCYRTEQCDNGKGCQSHGMCL